MPRIVICAYNRAQAERYIAEQNLRRADVLIASTPAIVAGLQDYKVVTLPGFFRRHNAQAIVEEFRRCGASQRASTTSMAIPALTTVALARRAADRS